MVLAGLFLAVQSCASAATRNPVVANTGIAKSDEGYEAALATAEAEGYPVIVKDKAHAYLRVASKSQASEGQCVGCYFEIKAWPGCVDVGYKSSTGRDLTGPEAKQLHQEGTQLAWAISTRARLLAGVPLGPTNVAPASRFSDTDNGVSRVFP